MAGHLDLHILATLEKFWPVVLGDAVMWDVCHDGIETAEAEKSRQELIRNALTFRSRLAKGKDAFPVVTVKLDSEARFREPMGNNICTDAQGNVSMGFEVQQIAIVEIFGKTSETARSIHIVSRAILQSSQAKFLEAGYDDFRYEGVDALTDVQELAAEDLGVYTRKVRYKALARIYVPVLLPVTEAKPWMVLAEDLTDDGGHKGKVKLGY